MASASSRTVGRFSAGMPRNLAVSPRRKRPAREIPAPARRVAAAAHDLEKPALRLASATTMPSITWPTRSSADRPMRGASFLHQHHNCDGDAGQPRTAAKSKQPADCHCRKHGKKVVPWQRADEGKRKAEHRPDQCAEQSIARSGNGRPEVGLEHDNCADGAPIAVVQPEARCQPPAERRQKAQF